MQKSILLLLVTTILNLFSITNYAWNALGHQVITHIAYQELTPTAKKKVDNLVALFSQDYPNIQSIEALSTWPDTIRSQKIETYTHWHYIDIPLIENDIHPLADIPSDNATWALEKIKPIVKNEKANQFERARFLAFYVHIVADLHQPLHTVSLFSAKHPAGDRGGNAYSVRYHNKATNLHALWDKGVGAFEGSANYSMVNDIATTLMHHYPKTYFAGRATNSDVNQWLEEGMKNAKSAVYNTPEGQAVSQQYINNGQKLAEEQATLAGYRLGNMLNELLG